MSLLLSRRRALAGAGLGAVLAAELSACSASSSDSETPAAQSSGDWPRTVSCDDGEVTIDAQPRRVVSTSVTLTGSLLAVGAPVVASGATAPDNAGLTDSQGFFVQWSERARDAGVEKLFENSSPDMDRVLAYEPDLILVAKTGADSFTDSVEQLRDIAPVLVIDYGGRSWQDVTALVGAATGCEAEAREAIADVEMRLTEVKDAITVPEGTTSAFVVFESGGGEGAAAILTGVSPQVQILAELGFTMAEIPDEVKGDTSMGQRQDIVKVSLENVQKGVTGDNWVVVASGGETERIVSSNAAFSTAAAYRAGRVAYLPSSTFRLDYYSALIMIDSLEESYAA